MQLLETGATMNIQKFATFISYVTMIANRVGSQCLAKDDIDELGKLVVNMMPEQAPQQQINQPVEIENLMRLMKEKEHKIDAIRTCRMLTGLTLKDAKDLVERYW